MIRTEIDCDTMDEEEEEDQINLNLNVTQRDINITYSLAKQPPHSNLTVEKLTQKFGTTKFLPALTTFLRRYLPRTTITPSYRDRFDAYKQILISLPSNWYLSDQIRMDRVRTVPSVKANGRALAKPSHFDTAFIAEDLPLYKTKGGIAGMFFVFNEYFFNTVFFLGF